MLDVQRSGDICILRLNAPPLNMLTFELLRDLVSEIASAASDDRIRGVVLTGGSEQFSAGADIHLFQRISTFEDSVHLSRTFQEAFERIEDASKPVVAAVAGPVVGGALEMAMACRYRIGSPNTRLGLPEVKLGIIPGAGGTQRLPRLVGPRQALRMMLTGDLIDAQSALAAGLLDAVCPPEQFPDRARQLLTSARVPTRDRHDKCPISELELAIADCEKTLQTTRAEVLAPSRIVLAVRTGLARSFREGLDAEQRSFAECMQTGAAKSKIHLFFATRQVAKLPELAHASPRDIRRAAVVGLGTMGTGIAQALLTGGFVVKVLDEQASAVERGVARIGSSMDRRMSDGKMTVEQRDRLMANLIPANTWRDLADADLIIESVFEDVSVKRHVLAQLEQHCAGNAILATNTSTISLDVLAEPMRQGDRLIGMHFFNPAQRMPLLEIIRRPQTPVDVLSTAVQAAKLMRKTPVVVMNRAGFLVSRLFVPYVQEAFELLEEGYAPREIDAAAIRFGFPMGPLVLIDMAGLDILVHTQRILQKAFSHHGGLSRIALRLVELGHCGQKTGRGVYRYDASSHQPLDSEVTAELIREIRGGAPHAKCASDAHSIEERLVLRMVSEAYLALEDGVARDAAGVDVATVLGVGFPDFRGGVCRYAEDLGLGKVRERLEDFAKQFGPRYSPCGLIRQR